MSALDDFMAHRACFLSGTVAEDLACLDRGEWDRLSRMRRELRQLDRADDLLFALTLSDEQWDAVTKLREALHSPHGEHNEEFRRMIVCTLDAMGDPTPPEEMSKIDDLLEGEDPEAGKDVDVARRRLQQQYVLLKARAGLSTIQEVAQKAGISPTTVHAIEKHAVRPQFRTVRKLAAAFGAPVTDLWPG